MSARAARAARRAAAAAATPSEAAAAPSAAAEPSVDDSSSATAARRVRLSAEAHFVRRIQGMCAWSMKNLETAAASEDPAKAEAARWCLSVALAMKELEGRPMKDLAELLSSSLKSGNDVLVEACFNLRAPRMHYWAFMGYSSGVCHGSLEEIHVKDAFGATPLHWASFSNSGSFAALLINVIRRQESPETLRTYLETRWKGKTAVMIAHERGHADTVDALVDVGGVKRLAPASGGDLKRSRVSTD